MRPDKGKKERRRELPELRMPADEIDAAVCEMRVRRSELRRVNDLKNWR